MTDNLDPTRTLGLRLDIGCGATKIEGFIGVDRFDLPDVDIVCDLDDPLPFPDDSVEYVIASHSLEHIANLPATMQEISRICRDRAIITIIAPYHNTSLNLANPYHKQVFNEHTSRFFTEAPQIPTITSAEYIFPHATQWGLLHSDFSSHNYDLRLLKQEFFYFEPFRHLPDEEKRVLRQQLNNVCDQFLVHLLVVKSSIEDTELLAMSQSASFVETAAIAARRKEEHASGGATNIFSQLSSMKTAVESLPEQFAKLASCADSAEARALRLEEKMVALQSEIAALHAAQSKSFWRDCLIGFSGLHKAKHFARLLSGRGDLASQVDSSFRPLLEASLLRNGITRRHRLTVSPTLDRDALLAYRLPSENLAAIDGVEIAISVGRMAFDHRIELHFDLFEETTGRVITAGSRVITAATLAAPVRLQLPPVAVAPSARLFLRLAGSTELGRADVRAYEWQILHLSRRGPAIDRALFGRVSHVTGGAVFKAGQDGGRRV